MIVDQWVRKQSGTSKIRWYDATILGVEVEKG